MARCESCGMTLQAPASVSKHDARYCAHCQDQLTGQLRTREQVRMGSVEALMRVREISREEAEAIVDQMLPDLPRWQRESY